MNNNLVSIRPWFRGKMVVRNMKNGPTYHETDSVTAIFFHFR